MRFVFDSRKRIHPRGTLTLPYLHKNEHFQIHADQINLQPAIQGTSPISSNHRKPSLSEKFLTDPFAVSAFCRLVSLCGSESHHPPKSLPHSEWPKPFAASSCLGYLPARSFSLLGRTLTKSRQVFRYLNHSPIRSKDFDRHKKFSISNRRMRCQII